MSTYTPIASIVLASNASSVTFNGIPQNYTDLVLVAVAQNTPSQDNFRLTFNNDTGSNYSYTAMIGDGSSASSTRGTNATPAYIGNLPSSQWAVNTAHIMSYSNTLTTKTVVSRQSGTRAEQWINQWRNTAAISTIKVDTGSGNMLAGSTFNLYGIDASAPAQAKATGGQSVYTDGTNWYHIFYQSGLFTPTQALTANYLVVAGGGGGGSLGGGGGAGGLRSTVTATGGGGSLESPLSLSAQSYVVTVGAGGTGNPANTFDGSSGSNSTFSTITSIGGGRGGNNGGAAVGGSGGGGGNSSPGAAGTANQGYAGGGVSPGNSAGSGGGGAGSVGANANTGTNAVGGNGGSGVSVAITGSSVSYAGGGGGCGRNDGGGSTAGGTATAGGGAGGASNTNGTAGTANTGGGGGGGGYAGTFYSGGNGGSGIVVVRYPV